MDGQFLHQGLLKWISEKSILDGVWLIWPDYKSYAIGSDVDDSYPVNKKFK